VPPTSHPLQITSITVPPSPPRANFCSTANPLRARCKSQVVVTTVLPPPVVGSSSLNASMPCSRRLRPRLDAVVCFAVVPHHPSNSPLMVVPTCSPPPGMRLGDLSSIYGTSESPTFWTPDVDLFGPIAPPATAALHGPPLGASAFVASAPPPPGRRGHCRGTHRCSDRFYLHCGPCCNFGLPRGPPCNMAA
jgi:hypothetical protein